MRLAVILPLLLLTFIPSKAQYPAVAGTATSASTSNVYTHNVSLPAGIQNGDLLLIFWADRDRSSTVIIPTDWLVLYNNGSSNYRRLAIYKVANGTEGTTIQITITGQAERSAHNSYRISAGTYLLSPVSATVSTGSGNPNPDPPILISGFGVVPTLWIAASHSNGDDNNPAPSPPTNYSDLISGYTGNSGNRNARMITARRALTASSEDPNAFTLGSNVTWGANTIAIQAAPPTITLGPDPFVCQGTTSSNLTYTATTNNPDQYRIDWDATAEAQGFVDVSYTTLPASPIILAIPAGAAPGTYLGILKVKNSTITPDYESIDYNISVTINENPTAYITPDPAEICEGGSLSFYGDPSGGSGVYVTHRWTGSGASFLSDTTIVDPIFSGAPAGTYSLTYTVTDDNGCIGSDDIIVTVNSVPSANITPDPAGLCEDGSLQMHGNPTGGSGIYTHYWSGSGSIYLSATDIEDPVFSGATPGQYQVIYTVTDDNNCSASDTIMVVVNIVPSAGITPDPAILCYGGSLSFNGNPMGGTTPYSHLWTGSGATYLSSTTVVNPVFSGAPAGTYGLTYTVTDNNSCSGSDTVTVTVNSADPGQIAADQVICYGALPDSLVSLSAGTGYGEISYEWQTDATGTYVTIPGATGAGYQPPALTATTHYHRRTVSDLNGVICYSDYTLPVTITVLGALNAPLVYEDQEICYNTSPDTLTMTLPTGGSNIFYFQWQDSTSGSTWVDIIGATGIIYAPPPLIETTYYRVLATDSACGGPLTSNNVEIIVWDSLVAPSICCSQVVCLGSDPSPLIGVPATGGSPFATYQWQRSLDGNDPWTDIPGATNPLSYTPPGESWYYRLMVFDVCDTLPSNIVQIAMGEEFSAGIVMSGYPLSPVCPGDTFLLNVNSYLTGFYGHVIRYYWTADPSYVVPSTGGPVGATIPSPSGILYYIADIPFSLYNFTDEQVITTISILPAVFVSPGPPGGAFVCALSPQNFDVVINPFSISCPENIIQQTDPNTCSASVAVPNPVYNFGCEWDSLSWFMTGATSGSSSGTQKVDTIGTYVFNLGETIITYVATDTTGNVDSCSFSVTVHDLTPPLVIGSIPYSIIAGCDTVNFQMPPATTVAELEALGLSISDNCTPDAELVVSHTDEFSGNCPIQVTRTYMIIDSSGNSSLVVHQFGIDDTEPPEIICPEDSVVTVNQGITYVHSGTSWDAIATDNCTPEDSIVLTAMLSQGPDLGPHTTLNNVIFYEGITQVTWTATDECGNLASCTFYVTVFSTADLSLTKQGPATIIPGDTISYIISITNNGPAIAPEVLVTDTVPAQVLNPEFSYEGAPYASWQDTLTIYNFPDSTVQTIIIRGKVDCNALGALLNKAFIELAPPLTDPDPMNDTSLVITILQNGVTASISPHAPVICQGDTIQLDGISVGGSLPYTHLWSGSGSAYLNAVNIEDPLFIGTAPGTFGLRYTVIDENFCSASDSIEILVKPLPVVTCPAGFEMCCNEDTVNLSTLSGTSPPGGVFTGIGVIYIEGAYYFIPNCEYTGDIAITYTYTDPVSGCTNSCSFIITVRPVPDASITVDYCAVPGYILLKAHPEGMSYLWSTGATSDSILIDLVGNYWVIVTDEFGCSKTAYLPIAIELVSNGDFSLGNTGFISEYEYKPDPYITGDPTSGLWPEGKYHVWHDAQYTHSNFWGYDHTTNSGNPGDNFMIINGWGSELVVWQQGPVPVQTNTEYYFAAWAISLNDVSPFAELRFEIVTTEYGQEQVGTIANLTAGIRSNSNPWKEEDRFYGTWNSRDATSAIIRIRNLEPALPGNDFGLDDISFGTLDPPRINVDPQANHGVALCEGDTLYLEANVSGGVPPFTFSWTGPNGFVSALENPLIPDVTLAAEGWYHLTVSDESGCPTDVHDSTYLEILPAPGCIISGNDTLCPNSDGNIYTGIPGMTSYNWSISGNGSIFGATDNDTVLVTAGAGCGAPFFLSLVVFNEANCDSACSLEVFVEDSLRPFIICPGSDTVMADPGETYATLTLPPPAYSDNCADSANILIWWIMTGATEGSGSGLIPDPTLFNVGLTRILYNVRDECENENSCEFIILVLPNDPPEILCPNDTTAYTGSTNCTNTFDPGSPDTITGTPPFTWTWFIIHETDTTVGNTNPITSTPVFEEGITEIYWIASNIAGADTCLQTITVLDTISPTFILPPPYECCVLDLISAIWDGQPDPIPGADIMPYVGWTPPVFRRPDSCIYETGSEALNVTGIADNCCPESEITIYWTIKDSLGAVYLSGTGQLSDYPDPIVFMGNELNTEVEYTITFYLIDCNGVLSEEQTQTITVKPRPHVIKQY